MDNENRVEIDPARCKGCGVCVTACPKGCLAMSQHLNWMGYPSAEFSPNGCTACGFCFYACPEFGAIKVFRKDAEAQEG